MLELAERIRLSEVERAVDAVLLVTEAARDALVYRKGVTTSWTTVSEALDQGAGVCQDFAHLGLALLRLVGVPCRYVSGYLHRSDLAEVETHAWCEAFIPSFGWLAFDPTHGEMVGDCHVAVAAGRSYADVPPNRGVYRGEAEEKISAAVTIQPVDARPRVRAVRGPPFHASRATRDAPRSQVPGTGDQLEQQQQQQQQDRSRAQVQQQRQQQEVALATRPRRVRPPLGAQRTSVRFRAPPGDLQPGLRERSFAPPANSASSAVIGPLASTRLWRPLRRLR